MLIGKHAAGNLARPGKRYGFIEGAAGEAECSGADRRTKHVERAECDAHAKEQIKKALDNLDGDASLLLKLLQTFATDKRESLAEIHRALAEKEWRTGERLAHGIKGIAGYIAAGPLYRIADRLEKAFETGAEPDVRALLPEFGARLEEVLAAAEILARACPELVPLPPATD